MSDLAACRNKNSHYFYVPLTLRLAISVYMEVNICLRRIHDAHGGDWSRLTLQAEFSCKYKSCFLEGLYDVGTTDQVVFLKPSTDTNYKTISIFCANMTLVFFL